MTDLLLQGSNRSRALAFRDQALLAFREAGISALGRPDVASGRHDNGQVVGLPWTLWAHARHTLDLSGDLDHAALHAALHGNELYATVQRRTRRSPEEAYVVMPVSVFAKVLLLIYPEDHLVPGIGTA